jgi:hypothetical protein
MCRENTSIKVCRKDTIEKGSTIAFSLLPQKLPEKHQKHQEPAPNPMSQIKVSQFQYAPVIASKKAGDIVNIDRIQKALEIHVKG